MKSVIYVRHARCLILKQGSTHITNRSTIRTGYATWSLPHLLKIRLWCPVYYSQVLNILASTTSPMTPGCVQRIITHYQCLLMASLDQNTDNSLTIECHECNMPEDCKYRLNAHPFRILTYNIRSIQKNIHAFIVALERHKLDINVIILLEC